MLDRLDNGAKAADIIIKAIEKIFKSIINIKDSKRKKEELKRLLQLLDKTRIGRTLNSNLLFYLKESIEAYQGNNKNKDISKNEVNIAIEQIEQSISAILVIISEMADKSDKVLIYQNQAWNDLTFIVTVRGMALRKLKRIELNKENLKLLENFATNYEMLTNELRNISLEISKYARELDEGIK